MMRITLARNLFDHMYALTLISRSNARLFNTYVSPDTAKTLIDELQLTPCRGEYGVHIGDISEKDAVERGLLS